MTPSYHRPKQKAREQRGTKQSGANGLEQSNAEQSKAIRTSDSVAPRSGLGHVPEEEGGGYGGPPRLSEPKATPFQQRTWPTSRPRRKYELDGI